MGWGSPKDGPTKGQGYPRGKKSPSYRDLEGVGVTKRGTGSQPQAMGKRSRHLGLETGLQGMLSRSGLLPFSWPELKGRDGGCRSGNRIGGQIWSAKPMVTLAWSPETPRPQLCHPSVPSPGSASPSAILSGL